MNTTVDTRQAFENTLQSIIREHSHGFSPRRNTLWEYISPFGFISQREAIVRLLSFFAILGCSIALLVSLYRGPDEAPNTLALSVFVMVTLGNTLNLWFAFATLAKDNRTFGMPLPLLFSALSLTPALPFFFVLKFFLRSKLDAKLNRAKADYQYQYRQNAKAVKKHRTPQDSLMER
ncbi:MAG: hypothetical protein ACPG4U_01235 [Pseudomonadales bacterium]